MQGRFVLGPRLGELASAAGEDRLLAAAGPVLGALRDHTNESAQLFRRQGDMRICVAAAERPVGLGTRSRWARRCRCSPAPRRRSARLGGAGPAAPGAAGRGVHRHRAVWCPPARLGAECGRAGARRRIGLGTGARAVRPGRCRRLHLRPHRAAVPAAGAASCSDGRGGREQAHGVLRRHHAMQQQQQQQQNA